MFNKHFDHNEPFIWTNSGHFEKSGAAHAESDQPYLEMQATIQCNLLELKAIRLRLENYLDSYCKSDSNEPIK